MKGLFKHLKKYRKESLLAPFFKMIEALFDLFVPLVVADIINVGIMTEDRRYVYSRCGLLVILAVIGLFCSIVAQYFAAKAAVGCASELRHSLFAQIQTLGFSEIDGLGTETLITRMTSDINQVQSGINLFLRLFLRSPFVVFGAMIMAFTINFRSAMIFAVSIPILALIVFGIMLITGPMYKRVQGRLDTVLGITRENLQGVRVVRAFGREEDETKRFEEANAKLASGQLRVGRISSLMNPMTYLVVNLAIIAILNTGAVQINSGILRTGDVIALINYMSQILIELVKLANLIIQVTKAVACAGRVQAVLDISPEMSFPSDNGLTASDSFNGNALSDLSGSLIEHVSSDVSDTLTDDLSSDVSDSSDPDVLLSNVSDETADCSEVNISSDRHAMLQLDVFSGTAVQFSHVGLRYSMAGAESLTDIDFSVPCGYTVGIIGGTGSGKTSLVNLIPRFYDATSGTVSVFGKPVSEYSKEELRKRIGMVMQRAQLFSGTIRSNLKLGAESASDEQLWEALETARAADFVRGKPGGLDAPVSQNGRNLSGGQKQRLTIARALVTRPEILILDDSSSALDFATDAALRESLSELHGKTTIFIVSQRASSLRHADMIIVMDDGKIVGLGEHDELLSDCLVYREIYESQFGA